MEMDQNSKSRTGRDTNVTQETSKDTIFTFLKNVQMLKTAEAFNFFYTVWLPYEYSVHSGKSESKSDRTCMTWRRKTGDDADMSPELSAWVKDF